MNRMFRTRAVMVLVFMVSQLIPHNVSGQSLTEGNPESLGFSLERLKITDSVMNNLVEQDRIAGAVTLAARHGKIAHVGTYGFMDKERGTKMRRDTIFRIASMTKPMTSLAVLMLYEEGYFLLTDPVSKYIPEFKNMTVLSSGTGSGHEPKTVPAKREITIRHLLSHTAGLTYSGGGPLGKMYADAGIDELRKPQYPVRELVMALAKLPLAYQPGESFRYSLSDDVLGYLIEVVTGMSFDRFLEERLFIPLGMKDTRFYLSEDQKTRLASLYQVKSGGEIEKTTGIESDYAPPNQQLHFAGGSGLYSTVDDYARFCQMLLNDGELDGVRIVSRKTVELLSTNSVGDIEPNLGEGGDKWGFGVSVRTKRIADNELLSTGSFMKSGAWSTYFWIDPKEDMFGVFMTQLRPLTPEIYFLFSTAVIQTIMD
ncbi:serine hydrolase domain-containing protein [Candidatus Latescibacterota bacterium]